MWLVLICLKSPKLEKKTIIKRHGILFNFFSPLFSLENDYMCAVHQ